uniref:Mir2 n=1 Tax=Arundo donax TaxID=35708 RepID=A0A0A9AGX8_ARUDO
MNLKALSMSPPLQPWSWNLSQSISSCSDSDMRLPVTILLIPSTAATAENAQHPPHWPWSLTSATAPRSRQSTASGSCSPARGR